MRQNKPSLTRAQQAARLRARQNAIDGACATIARCVVVTMATAPLAALAGVVLAWGAMGLL